MKLNYLIIILLTLFSLSFISASSTHCLEQPVKQYSCANLTQAETGVATNYIESILMPDKSIAWIQSNMNQEGITSWYEFCNTTETGTYQVIGNNSNGMWACDFNVNPTGNISGSILDNSVLLIILGVSIILLTLAFVLKNAPLAMLSGLLFMVSGVFAMIYGFNEITDMYTRSVAGSIIALGIIITVAGGYEWVSESMDNSSEDINVTDESED